VADHIDRILEQWARERPDVDISHLSVFGRISRLARFLDREEDDIVSRAGINGTEYHVLCSLRRAGEPYTLTPGELTRGLMMTSGGTTKRLDNLERLGLIERCQNPHDRRGALITLTADGVKLVDELLEREYDYERRMLVFESDELAALGDMLRRCLEAFEGPAPDTGRRSRNRPSEPQRLG
jgi:DNA-binding MarR family transcriptional regulator